MDSLFDVVITGGGPAGAATALSLRSHAPRLSIALIEASRYEEPRMGETLPPPARNVLEHLGVWDAFQARRFRAVHGTSSAWGGAVPIDNEFIFMTEHTGWHLDRSVFDAMLAAEAASRGVMLSLGTRLRRAERSNEGWRLTLSSGENVGARFLVDATGTAAFTRRCGASLVDQDELVGIAQFFDGDGDPRTIVEAFENGWWYTAGLPRGSRVIVCMTDSDLANSMRLTEPGSWLEALDRMPVIGCIAREGTPRGPLLIRSAASRRLEPVAGADWLAVGDSASRFDPLSSQGIVKALRSGVFASYAIADWLIKGDCSGLSRFRRYAAGEFAAYAKTRMKYYREEQRWPESKFWQRRYDTRPEQQRA